MIIYPQKARAGYTVRLCGGRNWNCGETVVECSKFRMLQFTSKQHNKITYRLEWLCSLYSCEKLRHC